MWGLVLAAGSKWLYRQEEVSTGRGWPTPSPVARFWHSWRPNCGYRWKGVIVMKRTRRIALAMLLVFGIVLAVSASAGAEGGSEIYVAKSVTDNYILPGGTIHYRYEVTATDRFTGSTIVVTDDKCASVTATLGGGPAGAYNIGDTADFGYLNGFLGEKWIYTCNATAPAVNPSNDLTDIATVVGNIAYSPFTQFSDTDTYTLEAAVLRKRVALYWEYSHVIDAPATGAVPFGVDVFKNGVDIGDEIVTANTPLSLWLTPGTWLLQEKPPPAGYVGVPGRTSWNIGVIPREPNPRLDNTIFNIAPFDLAIEKLGPDLAYDADPVTFLYEVTNTGTGIVTPVVTDNKCSSLTYVSGDTVVPNGKINPGEVWEYSCTYAPDWNAAFPDPLTNTATVSDVEYPGAWTPLFGGDTNTANNTDTFTHYPFVLRKGVGLYNDGDYPDFGAFADNTTFWVKASLNGVPTGDPFTISENSPIKLWLVAGTWTFQEFNLPMGYFAFYPDATITFVTGTYPDWTHLNVTWSGCSHGYWKNHTPWPTSYLPGDLVGTYFTGSDFGGSTLAQALAFGGGSGVSGAEKILLKQAVATLLNEAMYGTAFGPYVGVSALQTAVSTALASDNRGAMTSLAETLDYWNNGICR